MGKKYNKVRIIPEQNRRICGGICVCQFTMVMSCVALVYLTVAIYMPSHRAFRSGLDPEPVTCQTTSTVMANNCLWASCGEWCLTKTSGFCPQINVTVRRNGTDIRFIGCTAIEPHRCPPVNLETLRKHNCNNGSECASLSGVFRCLNGHCLNISAVLQCVVRAEGQQLNSERDNVKLTGMFLCKRGNCTKIKHYNCDRYCEDISVEKTVLVMHDNDVVSANCERAEALYETNGTDPGRSINATEFWPQLTPLEEDVDGGQWLRNLPSSPVTPVTSSSVTSTTPPSPNTPGVDLLIVTCREVTINDDETISCIDGVNGSLVARNDLALHNRTSFNFTTFRSLYLRAQSRPADPHMRFAPPQSVLTIFPNSRLQINLEACVNTLQNECKEFVKSHGNDGRNDTAPSQFPCYFDKSNSFYVVARFDLEKTLRELVVAVAVPSALFVVSWVSLCAITRSVKVGDDARMRCQYCAGGADPDECTLPPPPRERHRERVRSDEELVDAIGAGLRMTPPRASNWGSGDGGARGAGGGDDDEETELVVAVPVPTHRHLEGRDNSALSVAS